MAGCEHQRFVDIKRSLIVLCGLSVHPSLEIEALHYDGSFQLLEDNLNNEGAPMASFETVEIAFCDFVC